MFLRVVAINLLAVILGFSMAIIFVNTRSYAGNLKVSKSTNHKKNLVVTVENNDYQFPQSKDYKGHEILDKDVSLKSGFNKKAVKLEKYDLIKIAAEYKRQDKLKSQAKYRKMLANQKIRDKYYLKLLKEKKLAKAKIEKEHKKELDELTVDSADIISLSID